MTTYHTIGPISTEYHCRRQCFSNQLLKQNDTNYDYMRLLQ